VAKLSKDISENGFLLEVTVHVPISSVSCLRVRARELTGEYHFGEKTPEITAPINPYAFPVIECHISIHG
jgi:hypothetical protein